MHAHHPSHCPPLTAARNCKALRTPYAPGRTPESRHNRDTIGRLGSRRSRECKSREIRARQKSNLGASLRSPATATTTCGSADRRAVIKYSSHRWQSWLQPGRQATNQNVLCIAALGPNARFCRISVVILVVVAIVDHGRAMSAGARPGRPRAVVNTVRCLSPGSILVSAGQRRGQRVDRGPGCGGPGGREVGQSVQPGLGRRMMRADDAAGERGGPAGEQDPVGPRSGMEPPCTGPAGTGRAGSPPASGRAGRW